jgi:hypothetical protein
MDTTDSTGQQDLSSVSEGVSPPPQPPFPLHIEISGLEEHKAHELGNFMGALVQQAVQAGFDLIPLEKIVLTDTYAEALAKVDRGFETTNQLTPTTEEFASGVAMVVHVKRGDQFKTQMVVAIGLAASALFAEDKATRTMSTATLFHEMAHVHDFGMQCRMMPKFMFVRLPNTLDAWLYVATNSIWSEYFATYVAAWLDENVLQAYAETFIKALEAFPHTVRAEIIAYRTHADIDRLLGVVSDRFGALFKFAGYIVGHLEGINKTLQELRPDDAARIDHLGFSPTLAALRAELIKMHDSYPNWTGPEAYSGLGDVFRVYLEQQGIRLEAREESFSVDVPFTRETLPESARLLFDLGLLKGR